MGPSPAHPNALLLSHDLLNIFLDVAHSQSVTQLSTPDIFPITSASRLWIACLKGLYNVSGRKLPAFIEYLDI
jgi:hypothetical protein